MGVSPNEGLALFEKAEECPHIFLDHQPDGTTGLARRLNENSKFCALRWTTPSPQNGYCDSPLF
jgi:hypothetical protein